MSTPSKNLSTVLDFVRDFHKSAATLPSEGKTSTPTKNVPDNLHPTKTGPLFADNSAELKKQVPLNVEVMPKAKDNTNSTTDDTQLQLGLSAGPTGHDVETPKAGFKDPGSSHPARVDNSSLNGGKYAAYAGMELDKLASDVEEMGNLLIAELILDARARGQSAQKAASAPATPATPAAAPAAQAPTVTDAQLKAANDRLVVGRLALVLKEAQHDAINVATYAKNRNKVAGLPGDDATAGGPPVGGPPAGGLPPGGAPPMPPAPGGASDPAAGGPPTDASGSGSASPSSPEELMSILAALGVSPQDLEQAIAEMKAGGGAPGGAPSDAGGPPTPGGDAGGPPAPGGDASTPPPGGDPTKAAGFKASMEEMASVISELVARSRQKAAAAAAAK